ncbi:trans-sialidase, putative, partial [Trypanosoma cruzi marinkellei]
MGDGKLLFPVEGTIKKKGEPEKNEKAVSLIIYTLSSGTTSWTLSKGMSDGGCGDPSVVEWKDKLMMMTACDDGRRRVYESGDKGESWTEALGTLSRVWINPTENEKSFRSGFTTGTFGEENVQKNVMLVTLPVYPKEKKENGKQEDRKGVLHLWLTDNTHIVDIGPVSGNDDAAASSLLYKSGEGNNEELIALYEKKKDGDEKPSPAMASVRLTAQLDEVKKVLKTWKEVDKRVSQLCLSESDEGASTGTPCSSTFNITDGLVGFLSGKFSETTWSDEYLGVNATVKVNDGEAKEKAEAVTVGSDKGVTFRGAWAEWPVGKQGENQLYHFANYNFTLVATVSIDGEPTQEGSISLMGVKMNGDGNEVLLGLSYNKKAKKWELLCNDGKANSQKLSTTKEPEKTHQLAIVLRNSTQGSAYVDGESVGEATCELKNKGPKGVSHFFIGEGGGSASDTGSGEDVSVTVRNVLLYNRPLNSGEITALNTKLSISKQKNLITETAGIRAPEVRASVMPEAVPESDHDGQHLTAKDSLKRGEDPSSVGEPKSAKNTLMTSSSRSQSAERLASGGSPDGTQTMDGASSPDVNPTVEAGRGAGGTVQDGTAVGPEVGVSSGENGEMAGRTGGREEK